MNLFCEKYLWILFPMNLMKSVLRILVKYSSHFEAHNSTHRKKFKRFIFYPQLCRSYFPSNLVVLIYQPTLLFPSNLVVLIYQPTLLFPSNLVVRIYQATLLFPSNLVVHLTVSIKPSCSHLSSNLTVSIKPSCSQPYCFHQT